MRNRKAVGDMDSILQIDNLTVSFDGFRAVNNVNTGSQVEV
ncbi:MAG: hypothetical protein WA125_14815 [Desulfosporosinus sp.]